MPSENLQPGLTQEGQPSTPTRMTSAEWRCALEHFNSARALVRALPAGSPAQMIEAKISDAVANPWSEMESLERFYTQFYIQIVAGLIHDRNFMLENPIESSKRSLMPADLSDDPSDGEVASVICTVLLFPALMRSDAIDQLLVTTTQRREDSCCRVLAKLTTHMFDAVSTDTDQLTVMAAFAAADAKTSGRFVAADVQVNAADETLTVSLVMMLGISPGCMPMMVSMLARSKDLFVRKLAAPEDYERLAELQSKVVDLATGNAVDELLEALDEALKEAERGEEEDDEEGDESGSEEGGAQADATRSSSDDQQRQAASAVSKKPPSSVSQKKGSTTTAAATASLKGQKKKKPPVALRGDINDLPAARAANISHAASGFIPASSLKSGPRKQHEAAAGEGAAAEMVVEHRALQTYRSIEKLFTVVLVRRAKTAFPNVKVAAKPRTTAERDSNDVEFFYVDFEVSGPRAQAQRIVAEIESFGKERKHRILRIVVPRKVERHIIHGRLPQVPYNFDAVANFRDWKGDGHALYLNALPLGVFDGRGGGEDDLQVLECDVVAYLSNVEARHVHQQFRKDGAAAGGEGDSGSRDNDGKADEVKLTNNGGNSCSLGEKNGDSDGDEAGLGGNGGEYRTVSRNSHPPRANVPQTVAWEQRYEEEMLEIDRMEHTMAIARLRDLVFSFKDEWQDKTLPWHRFLYRVEHRYAMAKLAQYEMPDAVLRRADSGIYADMLQLDIHHRSGVEPFTERRPSVGVDDTITIKLPGGQQAKLRVFCYTAVRITMRRAPGETTPIEAIVDRPVHVIFDPEPFSFRCEALRRGTTLHEQFDWLRSPSVFFTQEELLRLMTVSGTDAPRVPARSVRGRGGALVAPAVAGEQQQRSVSDICFEGLSESQSAVIRAVLQPPQHMDRISICGPPGTGKTEALSRLIVLLLASYPESHGMMIVAPTQNAVDVLCRRVLELLQRCKRPDLQRALLRYYPLSSHPLNSCPELLQNTNIGAKEDGSLPLFADLNAASKFAPLGELEEKRCAGVKVLALTVGSVRSASRDFAKKGLMHKVAHLFMDEVAQTHLSDALSALSVVQLRETIMVFSGDEEQIRPAVLAPFTRSFLQKSPLSFVAKGTLTTVALQTSFRASAKIVAVQSAVFYGSTIAHAGSDAGHTGVSALDSWSGHNGHSTSAIKFFHCEGEVESENASFINRREVNIIFDVVLSVTRECGVDPKDIAVICKFQEQRTVIRQRLVMSGLRDVRVADIQDFNGDEREVVITSLVQSEYTQYTGEYGFFVRNELNAVIGRARTLVVFVGNGKTIAKSGNRTWKTLMDRLRNERGINGYDYESDEFDPKRFVAPHVPKGQLKVKEFTPAQSHTDRNDARKVLIPQAILENPHDFFIGTVVSNSDRAHVWVRNRSACGTDVLVETETSTGGLDLTLIPGDVVALRIDPTLHRWKRGSHFAPQAAEARLPLLPTALRNSGKFAYPHEQLCGAGSPPPCQVMPDTFQHALIPRGVVACVLSMAQPPLLTATIERRVVEVEDHDSVPAGGSGGARGRGAGGAARGCGRGRAHGAHVTKKTITEILMRPTCASFPPLPFTIGPDANLTQEQLPQQRFFHCCLSDRQSGRTEYIIRGVCPNREGPPPPMFDRDLNTGHSVQVPPVELPPVTNAAWLPGEKMLLKAEQVGGGQNFHIWLGIPLALHPPHDVELRMFNSMATSCTWHSQAEAKAQAGAVHCIVLELSISLTAGNVAVTNAVLHSRMMQPGNRNRSEMEALAKAMRRACCYARQSRPGEEALPVDELELWFGHFAALEMLKHIPEHAMLTRYCVAMRTEEEAREGRSGSDAPEWYVPYVQRRSDADAEEVVVRGGLGTLALFARICGFQSEYPDLLALRLLCVALRLRQGGGEMSESDRSFLRAVPQLVRRINSHTLAGAPAAAEAQTAAMPALPQAL